MCSILDVASMQADALKEAFELKRKAGTGDFLCAAVFCLRKPALVELPSGAGCPEVHTGS